MGLTAAWYCSRTDSSVRPRLPAASLERFDPGAQEVALDVARSQLGRALVGERSRVAGPEPPQEGGARRVEAPRRNARGR